MRFGKSTSAFSHERARSVRSRGSAQQHQAPEVTRRADDLASALSVASSFGIYIEGYVAWHLFSGLYIEGIDRSKRGSCSFRKGAMLGR